LVDVVWVAIGSVSVATATLESELRVVVSSDKVSLSDEPRTGCGGYGVCLADC
jgi:hypothetical protein